MGTIVELDIAGKNIQKFCKGNKELFNYVVK